jgi:hypothetical protein
MRPASRGLLMSENTKTSHRFCHKQEVLDLIHTFKFLNSACGHRFL